jgi:hypothetical protein
VALFFEGEPIMVILPATHLRDIHRRSVELGDASYSGRHDAQWRVDFYLSDRELSPQGSNGRRYDISRYVVQLPV